jgi:Methyltransferase FkbM domain
MVLRIIIGISLFISGCVCIHHDTFQFNHTSPNGEHSPSPRRSLLGKHHHHKSPRAIVAALERKYSVWLSEYKAATPDPDQQEMCYNIVAGLSNSSFGEHQQDMYIFHNFFRYWPMEHKKGFYVDIGSEDAIRNSKSAFFDVCLGWDGICIEPDEKHHEKIRTSRTCKLLPYCISDKPFSDESSSETAVASASTSAAMTRHSWLGFLGFNKPEEVAPGAEPVQCYTLDDLITRHPTFKKRRTIDLLSMDIGGQDIAVIKSANLTGISINTIIFEDTKFDTRVLDRVLGDKGFLKFHQLPYNSVYMPRKASIWYPWNHEKQWEEVESSIRGNSNKNNAGK